MNVAFPFPGAGEMPAGPIITCGGDSSDCEAVGAPVLRLDDNRLLGIWGGLPPPPPMDEDPIVLPAGGRTWCMRNCMLGDGPSISPVCSIWGRGAEELK